MNTTHPPRVLVASANPVKALAFRLGFRDMFSVDPELVYRAFPSGVSDQPMSDAETLRGAENRVQAAQESKERFDLYVGIEGGIDRDADHTFAFAWIVVAGDHIVGRARSATFPLPARIVDLIDQGIELGKADDVVFGVSNSKQDGGAVGLLTDGVIDRLALYRHATAMALIPFKNRPLFEPHASR